jgi:hypothetical protein
MADQAGAEPGVTVSGNGNGTATWVAEGGPDVDAGADGADDNDGRDGQ